MCIMCIFWHVYIHCCLGFPTQLTRKHVADMFFQAELEAEARKANTNRLERWRFKRDSDQGLFIEEVIENAQSSLYLHHQSKDCTKKGSYGCMCCSCVHSNNNYYINGYL